MINYREHFPSVWETANEQMRQLNRWGKQKHPDYTEYTLLPPCPQVIVSPTSSSAKSFCDRKAASGNISWSDILIEEVLGALEEAKSGNIENLRVELIQVAAVCCSWADEISERGKV